MLLSAVLSHVLLRVGSGSAVAVTTAGVPVGDVSNTSVRLEVARCEFTGNTAASGSGSRVSVPEPAQQVGILSCVADGGAVYLAPGNSSTWNVTIANSVFLNNTSAQGLF